MKILLVKCPRALSSHFQENSESLALAYLAATIRQQGFQVEILDAALVELNLEETAARILLREYQIVGFTIADPSYIYSTFEVIKTIRAKGVNSHITIGGYAPTFNWKEVLEACPEIDSVVMYEGEEAIVELATALKSQGDWRDIQNLAFRKNGEIIANLPRPLIKNLDALPFPSRDTLPYILEHKKETGVVSISGSRGCYANCEFCSIRAFYDGPSRNPWRTRSVKNIVDEIEYLWRNWEVKEIVFVDDVFIGPGRHGVHKTLEFADEIEHRKLKVMFSITERADNITYDIFKRLYDIGVRQTLIGLEAGTQETLNIFNKKTTISQNKDAIATLHQIGIDITASFINFAFHTSLEELRKNLTYLLSLNINFLQGLLNRFTVYSGTPMAKRLADLGKIRGSFPDYIYSFEDKRTEIAYRIVQNSLGSFLSMAYELKRLERKLRLMIFDAQCKGVNINNLVEGKRQYKYLEISIMKEASEIFCSILDFAENADQNKEKGVLAFSVNVAKLAYAKYVEWKKMIKYFETFAPCFNNSTEEELWPTQIIV